MATWIENQPVYFGESNTCRSCDGSDPSQLVGNGDTSQVQFLVEPCEEEAQLMPDPNFEDPYAWTLGENWSIEDNTLCLSGESEEGSTVYTGNPMVSVYEEGFYYQVNISVLSMSSGSVGVYFGETLVGTITSIGEYSFYGFPSEAGVLFPFQLVNLEDGTEVCISEITTYWVRTEVILAFYDSGGTYQTQLNPTDNTYSFQLSKNTITVTIDWASLDLMDGCYYICLLDPCQNTNGQNYPPAILNPTFNGEDDWTYGDGWINDGGIPGAAVGEYLALSGNCVSQENVFTTYSSQSITIRIQSISGSAGSGVNVYFGDALVGSITTAGTHTITGVPEGNLNLYICAILGTTEVVVKEVQPVIISSSNYVCNSTSNDFRVGDYTGACTLLINACNDEDGMGFVFDGSGFTPRIRIEAKLKQAKYPSERSVYEDSAGDKSPYYYKRRKAKTLAVDLQPEYVHDFLSLLVGFDKFYIDGIAYTCEDDEYDVEYTDASDTLGSVNLLVSIKEQDVKNTNCSGAINECILDGNFLLEEGETTNFITLENGEKISIVG